MCLAASVYRNIDLAAMPVKAEGNINRDYVLMRLILILYKHVRV